MSSLDSLFKSEYFAQSMIVELNFVNQLLHLVSQDTLLSADDSTHYRSLYLHLALKGEDLTARLDSCCCAVLSAARCTQVEDCHSPSLFLSVSFSLVQCLLKLAAQVV